MKRVRPRTALLALLAAPTIGVSAAASAEPGDLPPPLASRVDRVLVYSTQARVFRAVRVTLPAGADSGRLALADLPAAAESDSIQVECKSAEVRRVEVIRSTARLSRQAGARELLDKLERHTDALEDLQGERQILEAELAFLRGLVLRTTPPKGERPAAEGLFAEAWKRILVWMDGRSSQLAARLAVLAARRKKILEQIHALQVAAQDLDTDKVNRITFRVVATLRGRPGVHRLVLSYRVGEVRWMPSYDLRFDPRRHVVEAAYYAVVNQSTGEDWTDARLRFSTAMPTQLLALPELPTWTLGRRRDFTPTPRPRLEPAPLAWRPPEPSPTPDPVVAHLQQVLRRATVRPTAKTTAKAPAPGDRAESRLGGIRSIETEVTGAMAQARSERDVIKLNCLNDKLILIKGYLRFASQARDALRGAVARGDGDARDHELAKLTIIESKAQTLGQEARSCVGEQLAADRRPVEVQVDVDRDGIADTEDTNSFEDEDGVPDLKFAGHGGLVGDLKGRSYRAKARLELLQESALAGIPAAQRASGGGDRGPPEENVPWTDEGYRPPDLHRDLPAAGAKGYRFTLYAPGRHTVTADDKRRRIPLLRRELKVRPTHRILPGVSRAAFLEGTVTNTTGRPILRGHANLFAGTMFAGRSWLNTALPGKTIRLPLGVDDAIKVERHLHQRTVTKGILFKDDVTEHTVQIEIANHRDRAIEVELEDQLPRAEGRKAEVRAFSAWPKMEGPDRIGRVIWRGRVVASSVKKLSFTYQIVRPKDWELSQHDD